MKNMVMLIWGPWEGAENHTGSGTVPTVISAGHPSNTFQPTSADQHSQQKTFPVIQGLAGVYYGLGIASKQASMKRLGFMSIWQEVY